MLTVTHYGFISIQLSSGIMNLEYIYILDCMLGNQFEQAECSRYCETSTQELYVSIGVSS